MSPFNGSKSSKKIIPAQQGNPPSLKFKIEVSLVKYIPVINFYSEFWGKILETGQ